MSTLSRIALVLIGLLATAATPAAIVEDIFADGFEPSARVVINEVDSDDPVVGDWIELYNAGEVEAVMSGWMLSDDDFATPFTIPNTTLAPGAYLVFDRDAPGSFSFGLGTQDSVNLFNPSFTLVDSFSWSVHPSFSYGRCPNGTGALVNNDVPSKGSANNCP